MNGWTVEGTVAAARELSHAACHLASTAASLARASDSEAIRDAAQRALQASLASAACAFAMDDAVRARADDPTMLGLAIEATEAAEAAVAAARQAIEAHLVLTAGGGRVVRS